jgi:hypothetical protein
MNEFEQTDPYAGLVSEATEALAQRRMKANWQFMRYYWGYYFLFGLFASSNSKYVNVYAVFHYAFWLSLPVVLLVNFHLRIRTDRRLGPHHSISGCRQLER